MSEKTRDTLTEQADAAFRQAAAKVIELARQTGTPVIVWEEGRIVENSAEEAEKEPRDTGKAGKTKNVASLLPFQAPSARRFWFGPAFCDDSQICRHHQGLGIFNPDISDASEVLVDRRSGQGATMGAGFFPELVASHRVIFERFQNGLAHRAQPSPW